METDQRGQTPNASDKPPGPEDQAADQTLSWPIRRYRRLGEVTALNDLVVREQRIELVVNGTHLLAMLALPTEIEALALGFLASEGLWRDRARMPDIEFDPAAGEVRCSGDFDVDAVEGIHRRWAFGTGCGGGGTARDLSVLADCKPINSRLTVDATRLTALGKEFARMTRLYQMTGGVHACGLADSDGVLLTAEDVGRHNAFDKVAGMALLRNIDITDKIALTSGRLSAEIVAKAIGIGVPILASFSAPTAMGVQWSRRFGLTLIGFLRGSRMNVYTAYHRVVSQDD
ncbi:MAG: formate dehydrogenase accessory sulfurtransferase FdhD [Phycisphaerae bacterium]|jgi:FdhD protein